MLSYSNPSLNRLTFMLPISYNCLDKAMVHFGASFHINIFYITVSYDHILEMFFPGFLFWFFLQSLLTYFFCPIQRDVFLKISFLALCIFHLCVCRTSHYSSPENLLFLEQGNKAFAKIWKGKRFRKAKEPISALLLAPDQLIWRVLASLNCKFCNSGFLYPI